ncbi:hypothetical protein ACHAXT_008550 [Thalassiosira profunda]
MNTVASQAQVGSVVAPSSIEENVAAAIPRSSPHLAPVSRVVTKESLRGSSASSPLTTAQLEADDSSLFEFSLLLDSEEHEAPGELLSLPLSSVDVPLTPPPLQSAVAASDSFDSAAASLLTPAEVSIGTEASSSAGLLSTAAALAATQPQLSRARAVSNATALSVPSPKPQRRTRANSKGGDSNKQQPPKPKRKYTRRAPPKKKKALQPKKASHGDERLVVSPILPPPLVQQGPANMSDEHPDAAPAPVANPVAPDAPQEAPVPVEVTKYAPQPAYAPPPQPAPSSSRRNRAPSNQGDPPRPASASENTGRWTADEHRLFLQGLEQHGKGWKKIATLIRSRTVVQIRTHAQKYFQKLAKARNNGEAVAGMGTAGGTAVTGVSQVGGEDVPGAAMRTVPRSAHPAGRGGNMSLGSDPTSLAAAAGAVNIHSGGRRGGGRRPPKAAGTKRRAIGSVVRSAVREGRNAKRQRGAEARRAQAAAGQPPEEGGAPADGVPNPLPAVAPFVAPYLALGQTGMPPPPSLAGAPQAAPARARGRQQLIRTANHGTMPQAALEDAVFRALTPAAGGPAPPAPSAAAGISDPLAPRPPKAGPNARAPPAAAAAALAAGLPPGIPGPSPTGVADALLLPGWVDAANPPQWYADGSDIDTLLEDAEALNWLQDTGALEEGYPPALGEPAVVSSSSTAVAAQVEPTPVTGDPTGGVVHPSDESLSFLQTFQAPPPAPVAYAAATEAAAAAPPEASLPEHKLAGVGASAGDLLGFPDLDVGDEQAFVSALLDPATGPSE